jgi:tRNA A37 threonylcarbamoyladenosine modification protein TsaB
MCSVTVIALSSPLLVGIYKDDIKVDEFQSSEKSSESLAKLFDQILKKYEVKSIVYANGPGSFMAIKVSYIFLKTLSIVKNIPLFAIDAFYFNENSPIKAVGKLYFVKNSNRIETIKIDEPHIKGFSLPKKLNFDDFYEDALPNYAISAI